MSINLDLSTHKTIIPEPPQNKRRDFLTPIPDLPGEFLLVLDNTSLEKIKRCHKAAENYLVLGREAHAKNAALTFGGAIHEGLEKFHKWQFRLEQAKAFLPNTEPLDTIKELHGPAAQDQAIVQYFTENPAPPDVYRTVGNALEVLKHYRRRSDPDLHPDYEWEIMSDEHGPIIERAFEIPLAVLELWIPYDLFIKLGGNPDNEAIHFSDDSSQVFVRIHIAWSGRIDLIAKANQRIRIVDHKTTSISGDQFIQSFQLSSQTIGYLWAANQLWPSLDVSGFCLNAIAISAAAAKTAMTSGRSIAERGPKGGEPALSFFRAYYDYSPERIARWERDTVLLIEDFLHSLSRGTFPMNDRQCHDKFGVCPYFEACVIDDERVGRNLLMSDAFKQVTWNPTNGR